MEQTLPAVEGQLESHVRPLLHTDLLADNYRLACENERLRATLTELAALVRGECPSLLNEDSGGDARLDMAIDDCLRLNGSVEPGTTVRRCDSARTRG